MTEKRFTCETKTQGSISIDIMKDNGQIIEKFDAIKLLNELWEEKEQLKEENEQLKQQNDFLITQLAELSTYMMALGYDIELEFEDGRVIKLNEELEGDVE